MFYNLLNYPDGRNDCGGNLQIPTRTDSLKKILQYVKPDALMVCELQNSGGADRILDSALNVNGITYYAKATFVANQSGGTWINNMFFYNTNKLVLKSQDEILTDLRDFNVYNTYGNDASLVNGDTTFIDFIAGHFKAGSSASSQDRREEEADSVRKYVDAYPVIKNVFLGADYNIYDAAEAAYQKLITGGNYPFEDPISRPGAWNNNSTFSDIHTQSTRTSQVIECGASGGLDDRFDQVLVTNPVMTGADSVRYISGTYKSVGNDNNHYNAALIDAPANTVVPQDIATALYYMSDHLPVIMDVLVNYPATGSGGSITLSTYKQNATCGVSDGVASVTAKTGTAPITYKWSNGTTTQTISSLSAGTYYVTVTDANSCISDTSVAITGVSAMSLTLNSSYVSCQCPCPGSIWATPSGGDLLVDGSYDYSWNTGVKKFMLSDLCPGTFTVTVTDDAGCTVIASRTIP